jgi:hypothetical protein
MFKLKKFICAGAISALALATLVTTVQAEPFQSVYQNARVLGMGGAFTAVADDYNALIYNPAGLTQIEGWELDLLTLEAEASESTQDLIDDLEAAQSGTEAEAAALLVAHAGDHIHARVNTFPHLVMPGFGVGLLGQATLDADFRNRVRPVVQVDATVDLGLTVAGAKSFNRGKLAIGIGGKYLRREGLVRDYEAADLISDSFDPVADVGAAETDYAIDLGLLYHLDNLPLSPTIGAAYLNLGDLDFGAFGSIPAQLNVGVAIRPKIGPVTVTVAADFVDVTHQLGSDEDNRKRTNLGAEAALWNFLAVRVGLHQSYFSAGATVNLWAIKVDVATYGEELGAYGGQREDRRYIARIGLF